MLKSVIAAGAIMASVGIASAADVSVAGAYDYDAKKWGSRLAVSIDKGLLGIVTPGVSATHVNDAYTQYSLFGSMNVLKAGIFNIHKGESDGTPSNNKGASDT